MGCHEPQDRCPPCQGHASWQGSRGAGEPLAPYTLAPHSQLACSQLPVAAYVLPQNPLAWPSPPSPSRCASVHSEICRDALLEDLSLALANPYATGLHAVRFEHRLWPALVIQHTALQPLIFRSQHLNGSCITLPMLCLWLPP